MNYAGIRYCPRCGEHIFKTTQIKDGSVVVWCSQCEHTMRISDHDSDPLMTVFEEWVGKRMTEKSGKVNESQNDFLKPCPCCGSTRIHVVAPDDGCFCWDCGLTMPNRKDWRERWNRRAKE